MGTDGDLRKLKLSKARSVLRNFGVPDEEVCCTKLLNVPPAFLSDQQAGFLLALLSD